MTARDAFFEWLRAREVRHVFGNPGSTELGMLLGLEEVAQYVLGLQEASVLATADGYAQATRQPALVNLHTAPGLGNALGALFTSLKNKTPLVVSAGQQDNRHRAHEPLLSGPLVEMARPVVKWSAEVLRSEDVARTFERAYRLALTPPTGPVFVSVPMNFWDEPGESVTPQALHQQAAPAELNVLLAALETSQRPALVMGAQVERDEAWAAAVTLAEKLGAAVFHDPVSPRCGFPTTHANFEGVLPPAAPALAYALEPYDVVAVFGAPLFLAYPYVPGPRLPAAALYLVSDDAGEAARAEGAEVFLGSVGAALAVLSERVTDRGVPPPDRTARARQNRDDAAAARPVMGTAFVFDTLAGLLPEGAVVVDEAISSSAHLRRFVPITKPNSYYHMASGGLGWAMPAAAGVALAEPGRRVVAVVGDGSALYSPQALWTVAQLRLPVTYLVVNNGGYNILKGFAQSYYGDAAAIPGLNVPDLDLVGLAASLGVQASRVENPDTLEDALRAALTHPDGPYLLDILIDPTVKPLV